MKLLHALTAVLALALPIAAAAQWQWLDKDGRKVFSDQAPPADIPAKNILKQPAGRATAAPQPAGATAPADAADAAKTAAAPAARPAASAPRLSGKDKELEEKKKQAEAAEAARKAAEEDRLVKARAENCERAKRAKASLDSGIRISTTNAKGERDFMSDQARAAETKRVSEIIAKDCQT